MNVYNLFEDDLGVDPELYEPQEKELPGGLIGDMALQLGLMYALPKVLKATTGKSLQGLALNAIAGAIYGGGVEAYKGGDIKSIAEETAKGAITWPMYEAGGKLLVNALKGARAAGLQGIKNAGAVTWRELQPEIESITKKPISRFLGKSAGEFTESRFAARNLEDLLVPSGEALLKSESPVKSGLGLDILFSRGEKEQINKTALDFMESMKNTFSFDEMRAANELMQTGLDSKKPIWMNQETYEKVKEKLLPIFEGVKKTGKTPEASEILDTKFRKELTNELLAKVSTTKEIDDILAEHLDEINANLQAGTKESLQDSLLKLTKKETIPENIRIAAQAYLDFPATSLKAVNRAYGRASLENFITNIRNVGKGTLVKPELSPGDLEKNFKYVEFGHNPIPGNPMAASIFRRFEGEYVDWDTYRALYDLCDAQRYTTNKLSRYIVRPWKVTRAVANPPALFRNIFGNFALNDVQGKHPLSIANVKAYYNSLVNMKNKSDTFKEFISKVGGSDFTEQELRVLESTLADSRSMAESWLKFFNKLPPIRGAEKIYSATETFAKFAKYEHNLALGMDKNEAIVDAVNATFNYSDVTPFIRGLRETVVPFATFASKMLQATPRIMVEHPIRAAKYVLIPWLLTQQALSNLKVTNEEFEQTKKLLPEYMQKGTFMLLPARDAKGRLQLFDLTWWLPGLGNTDITTFADPKQWISNPIYNIIMDLRANQKGLTTAPIYNDFDAPEIKLGKVFNYIYQSFFPTWMPSVTGMLPGVSALDSAIPLAPAGVNWKGVLDYMHEKEGALTPPQIAAGTLGLKITPVEEELLRIRKEKNTERLFRDLKAEMNKEIRNYPQDREYIEAKYARAKRRLEDMLRERKEII